MTREEARQAAEVMMAYAEGKEIELNGRSSCGCQMWEETSDPTFNWNDFMYRTKTKPKYRPFKTKEECWNEMMKHQPFGWIKGNVTGEYSQIIRVFEDETKLIFNTYYSCDSEYSPEMLLSGYTFTDGTPFGIKEE